MLDVDKMILSAMKEKNEIKLKVYRAIKAEILSFKTAKNAKKYDETAEIDLLKKMCKQRKDSIRQYKEANREDLVQSETLELEILSELVGKPVSTKELLTSLYSWSKQNSFLNENLGIKIPKKEMGKAIKMLKDNFPANDGKEISSLIKEFIC